MKTHYQFLAQFLCGVPDCEERVVRLQRLMATDPELRRPRMRWKATPEMPKALLFDSTLVLQDAAAVLARRDELQDGTTGILPLRRACFLWTCRAEALRCYFIMSP